MTPLASPTPLIQSFITGSTGWIVLNRPERRNSLNAEMWAAIPPLMNMLDGHADVRAIVIRGAGAEAFASGADISEFDQARNDAAAAARYERLNGEAFASIRGAARPVIARIQGFCIGGGLATGRRLVAGDAHGVGGGAPSASSRARRRASICSRTS